MIDLRSKAEFDAWHHEGALWLDFAQAMKAYPSFDRSKTYVLYCEFGLKSAHLAEFMRKEGFDASNFRGGTRALMRLVGEVTDGVTGGRSRAGRRPGASGGRPARSA